MYGVVLFCAAIAFTILLRRHPRGRERPRLALAAAIGSDRKGNLSLVFYVAAIPLAFVHVVLADALFVGVALIWLVPDRRIERRLQKRHR